MSTNDTRRVTIAATITASGEQLLPIVIFKGSPTGTIAKTEIPLFDPTSIYDVQQNAWMEERVMKHWVDESLQPYVTIALDDLIPVLLLDSYHCHIMHIPGGCNGLVQPLDVGFNRPFKIRIRQEWQAWMIETVKATGTIEPPERVDVSAWIADMFWDMKKTTIIKNAWLKKGYEWFNNLFIYLFIIIIIIINNNTIPCIPCL